MAEAVERHVPGAVLHGAGVYDLIVWLFTFGRERAFREKVLALARLSPGEAVLDIGCGTGTLAILAKQKGAGEVFGIDPSPEMIARAAKKAKKAGASVTFQEAAAQSLPFPEARFDLVLSTLMLHHMGRGPRAECLREVHRVLRPGGRLLAVDFGSRAKAHGLLAHLHHRHGAVPLDDILALTRDAGLTPVESGPVGLRDLGFVLATKA